jgi:hypothetical protein
LSSLARQEYDAARETIGAVATLEPGLATLLARQAASLAVNADLLARAAKSPGRGVLTPDAASPQGAQGTPGATGSTGATGTTAGGTDEAGPSAAAGSPGTGGATEPGTSGDTTGSAPAGGLSTTGLNGLNQELAGEHAAVYAFALLAGRSKGPVHEHALESYATHVRLRDALERTLLDAGADPPVASSAYDVGPVPSTPVAIVALAASAETSLTSLAAQSVGTVEGEARTAAASRLVEAARRSAGWTRTPTALPGPGVDQPVTGTDVADPAVTSSSSSG